MFVKRILWFFFCFWLGWTCLNLICAGCPADGQKNLFAPDRKQPLPESADTSAKAAKPGSAIGNIQLDGVIIQSNSKRAVLRIKNQLCRRGGQ